MLEHMTTDEYLGLVDSAALLGCSPGDVLRLLKGKEVPTWVNEGSSRVFARRADLERWISDHPAGPGGLPRSSQSPAQLLDDVLDDEE